MRGVDWMSRQGYKVSVSMAPCEHGLIRAKYHVNQWFGACPRPRWQRQLKRGNCRHHHKGEGVMTAEAPKFDPITYKETTRQQWETAAEAWHRWGTDAGSCPARWAIRLRLSDRYLRQDSRICGSGGARRRINQHRNARDGW